MKAKELPPVELLREMFSYDPETGDITWKVYRGRCAKVGDIAGSLHPLGYRRICIRNGKTVLYLAHRLAWALHYGEDPGDFQIDHINQVKDDNRVKNLRLATPAQNMLNQRPKSEVPGVKQNGKGGWIVTLKRRYIGSSRNYEKAVAMRLEAERADQDKEYFCTTPLV
jgi:hypothetical protein